MTLRDKRIHALLHLVANLELCKELYELSDWGDTAFAYSHGKVFYQQELKYQAALVGFTPAYDLGYLLWKLGEAADDYRIAIFTNDGKRWVANRTTGNTVEQQCEASTPEDAVCYLAIELFKQEMI